MKVGVKTLIMAFAALASGSIVASRAEAADATVWLKAQHSGRHLTVTGLLDNYPIMQRFTTTDDSRQRFEVKSVSGNVVQLRNVSADKCATVVGTPTQNWAAILLKPCSSVDTQKFYFNTLSNGVFELKTFGSASGACATIHDGSLQSGARLIQMACASVAHQRFDVKDSATGLPYKHGGSTQPQPTPVPAPRPTPAPTPGPTPVPTPQSTPTPVPPTTGGKKITTQAEFEAAMNSAKGGEVLLLSGRYSWKTTNKSYSSPVVITSLDPKNPAGFGYINVSGINNVTFRGLEFSIGATTATEGYMIKVLSSSNITFENLYVHGSLDGDARNDMQGIWVYGKNIVVRDTKFEQLNKGLNVGGEDIKVLDNTFFNMRHDGLNVGQVERIVVDGNSFYDFHFNSGDHRDGIQFMTVSSGKSSTDIDVSNNIIMVGPGASMQGIFITDQKGNLPYLRVKIRNNLVVQTYMSNGIMVSNGQDVEVTNNTVVSPTDDTYQVWIRMNGITNYKASGNIADSGGQMTGIQAGIDAALLKYGRIETVRPEQLIRPGIGFQLP